MSQGQIITFYSYKGGVGRTMALANAAVLLSRWGYRTLIIDWDLEAPGLEYFFKDFIDLKSAVNSRGVVDLLSSAPNRHETNPEPALDWRNLLVNITIPESKGSLYLLTAGDRGNSYFGKLRGFDLNEFYVERRGGEFVENLRNEWKKNYDFVLIDSRTGITDIGGICTIQLPDILVLLFTATEQGFQGIIDVAQKASEKRRELPVDRLQLRSIPIPTRFDTDKEFKVAQKWLDDFSEHLTGIYANWLPKNTNPRDFLEATKLPYVAYFSFGERLAVLEQGTNDPAGLGYAYETLSAIIANNLESANEVVDNRSKFVQTASKAQESPVKAESEKKELLTINTFNKTEDLNLHEQWLESKGRAGKRLDISHALLDEIDLSNASLSRSILSGTHLVNAKFIEADLSGADLTDADLQKANLSQANLRRANLQNSDLSEAFLEGAKMSEVNLENASLRYAELMGADLSHAKLHGAKLDGADFTEANLSDVNFTSTDLRRTILRHACLQGADLRGVADLREEQLGGTDLGGAKLPESVQKFELLSDFNRHELELNVCYVAINTICILTILIELLTRFSYSDDLSSRIIKGLIIPFLEIEVPVYWLYLTAPAILINLYLYFLIYMQGIWGEITILPTIFPDGKALHRKIRPKFIRKIIRAFSKTEEEHLSSNPLDAVAVFSLWFAVPVTITYYTVKLIIISQGYRYSLNDPDLSYLSVVGAFLSILSLVAFLIGSYFLKLAQTTFLSRVQLIAKSNVKQFRMVWNLLFYRVL